MNLRQLIPIVALYSSFCFAAGGPYEEEEAEIPKKPSVPFPLIQKVPKTIPHCERYFLFRGKKYECDSNAGTDAERLRSIVMDVPSAVAELDAYQEKPRKN